MKYLTTFALKPFVAALCLALLPVAAHADRKITVKRDLDGDGHYNKKTYTVDRKDGRYYDRGRYDRGRYYDRSRYYGRGYYGRPYHYDYGRSYYSRPSIGVSIVRSSPSVYVPRTSYSYSDELAVDVQRALKRRGYYGGPIDGDIGYGSRSAIRDYQADRGLPVTGRIDSRLLSSLGIG